MARRHACHLLCFVAIALTTPTRKAIELHDEPDADAGRLRGARTHPADQPLSSMMSSGSVPRAGSP